MHSLYNMTDSVFSATYEVSDVKCIFQWEGDSCRILLLLFLFEISLQ